MEATYPNGGCNLQKRQLGPHDRRYSRPGKTVKTLNICPRGVRIKNILTWGTQDVHLVKKTLAIHMAFLEFAHKLWDAANPIIVLTDNKSSTRFFQTKAIPPALWNACAFELQVNFNIAYIADSIITAAEFLSRLQPKVTRKIRHKVQKDIKTTLIELTTTPLDVTDQEQFFFNRANNKNESEEQTLERKEQSRQHAKQWVANQEPSLLKTGVKEFTQIDGNTTSFNMNGTMANVQILKEHGIDLLSKNLILKVLGQANEEVLITTNPRYKQYKANEDRKNLEVNQMFRQFYGKTGSVKYYQLLDFLKKFQIIKQLFNKVLRISHGEVMKHPGRTKTKFI